MEHHLPQDLLSSLDDSTLLFRPPREVFELIMDTALDLLRAQYGSLRWVNHREKTLVLKVIRDTLRATVASNGGNLRLDLAGPSVMAQVARHKQPLRIPDLEASEWQGK